MPNNPLPPPKSGTNKVGSPIKSCQPHPDCCCNNRPTPINPQELCQLKPTDLPSKIVKDTVSEALASCENRARWTSDTPQTVEAGCQYYQMRHEDYVRRHTCPECACHPPPDYYLNYGLKYCNRYTRELYPDLSPQGQQWLLKAKCNLQQMMEEGLQNIEEPANELDSAAFLEFAFNTHPQAYLKAGLADLSLADFIKISCSPDWQQWTRPETWKQALEAGEGVAKEKLEDGWEALQELPDQLREPVNEIIGQTLEAAQEQVKQALFRQIREFFDYSPPLPQLK